MLRKYNRPLLVATGVFAACFLLLKIWLDLPLAAAAFAAGISAAGAFLSGTLGLVKLSLEIDKLRRENRKLKREEVEALSIVRSPTLEEIDKFGLKTRSFVAGTHEEKL